MSDAGLLEDVRAGSEAVMQRALSVRLEEEALSKLCSELAGVEPARAGLDPAHHFVGDPDATLAYVVTLDALNFGSGWFPDLRKRPGLSGYFSMATALKERFERDGPWDAAALQQIGAGRCAAIFGQEGMGPPAAELMDLFATSLRDLGRWLSERWGGRFAGPVEAADGSAARLAALLSEMPLYRDVSRYDELEVPFFKRAQLTAADLSAAFEGRGFGAFHDLDRLTCFADNLVPHVLRCEGVLRYTPELAQRIDGGELIPHGSREEVEIRAAAVHSVERCVEEIARRGGSLRPCELDFQLWSRGQRPEIKAHPRHRTRTTFY